MKISLLLQVFHGYNVPKSFLHKYARQLSEQFIDRLYQLLVYVGVYIII